MDEYSSVLSCSVMDEYSSVMDKYSSVMDDYSSVLWYSMMDE